MAIKQIELARHRHLQYANIETTVVDDGKGFTVIEQSRPDGTLIVKFKNVGTLAPEESLYISVSRIRYSGSAVNVSFHIPGCLVDLFIQRLGIISEPAKDSIL